MNDLPSIELYSIGTELLMGQIQDTNAFWMAQQIAGLGGHIRRIVTMDDDVEDIVRVLEDAVSRKTRVIITTGGLGPTPDDLTIEAIARLKGVKVIVNESLVEKFRHDRKILKRENVKPALVKMATSPEGSIVHTNPAGVAPCVETLIDETTIYNLPGPPREVQALFNQTIEGAIAEIYTANRVAIRVTVNLPESELGPILQGVMAAHPNTYLKAYVALRERFEGGQRLPVDIVARELDESTTNVLLKKALVSFTQMVEKKGSSVEHLEDPV
ncbi:MAG: molybdopterin-binding protein [Candidatus Latescibacterota bacterium]|nr:molybdopterin-binding protein [Candidatus Latescibacterota bacterium]